MNNDSDTNEMTYETTGGARPRLRFAEFHGDWAYQKLSDIAFIITEKAGSDKYTLMSITAGVGLVSQKEKFGREIAGEQYKNYFVIREHDFAYNKSATKEYPEGFIAMFSGEESAAVPNSIFTCFRVQENKIIPQYLSYLFLANLHGKWLRNFITVGARAHGSLNVDNADLLSLPVPMPQGSRSLEEQQRIADCLASLDEIIAAQSQKLDALKAHKKALLQQLFPAEGKTVPRLRFPEFRGGGAWEEKKLGDITSFSSGGTPSKDNPDYWAGTIPWISAASMYDMNIIDSELKITDQAVKAGARIAKKGTLLILVRGSMLFNKVPMGIAAIDVAFNQDVKGLTIEDGIQANFLLYQLLAFESRIPINETGIGAGKIETDNLKRLVIYVPSSPERQRIADCLSSLDELIAAQGQKLDALKEHKKGLLQQLFPMVEG